MALFIGLIGILGAPCCLIWLIVSAIRSGSKKAPLIGILISCVLFFSGVMAFEPDDEPAEDASPKKQSDSVKDLQNHDSPEPGAEEKMEVIHVKPDTEDTEPESGGEEEAGIKTGDYQLPCGANIYFYDSVRNDVTGKWRRSGTSSSLPPADFAVEYYEKMFSSDDEIHSVWNATLKTTTKISVSGNLLFVDTFEYVDGEEHDAAKMFSGMLLDSQIIDLETGKEIEDIEPEPEPPAPAREPEKKPSSTGSKGTKKSTPPPSSEKTGSGSSSSSKGGNGNESNFFTYDNEDQQETEDSWVLNTSSMKIHYPSCREVKKIAPHNYSTSNLSESELKAKGYTACGVCH